MAQLRSIMYVPITKDTCFLRRIVQGYSYQANLTCFSDNKPTAKAVVDYFRLCKHDGLFILHGKGYFLDQFDLEDMVTELLNHQQAWCIGIHPYTDARMSLANEEPTWAGRVIVYRAELWWAWIDEALKANEYFVEMGNIAKSKGYKVLIANKARLFQIKDQPHSEELI